MTDLDISHFKRELSDYRYIKSKIARIEDQILELEVKRGIRSISYDRDVVQGSPDPLLVSLKRLEDTEKADELENEYMKYSKRLEYIVSFLRTSEIGDSIMRIHCTQQSTYEKESMKLNMGVRTLKRKVNREIAKYLEEKHNILSENCQNTV